MEGGPLAAPEPLQLSSHPGRLRRWRHRALLPLAALAGWAWFGATGAVPVIVWWWHRGPGAPPPCWRVDIRRVRRARLGPWRTRIELHGAPAVEIFSDEVDTADLARLRRLVKAQLAGN